MTSFPNSPKLIKGGIVLLDPETPRVAMPKSESICEEGGGSGGMGNNPEPSRDALDFWARWEKLSFKKQMALKKMLGVKTAKGGATVDWGKMNDMLAWAEPKEVAEIQRLASEAAKGDSSAIPGAVAKVKQAAEASTAKAKDGSGTKEPKSGDSTAAADGSNGNERDETQFAKRTGKISGKGGSPQADLSPRKIVTVYKGTPSKVGETVSGTVLMQWRKPMGETAVRLVKDVTLEFQRVGPEIEGDKLWIFRSTSDKAYRLVDRPGKFHFPLKQDIRLIVINAGEGKK